MNKTPLILGFLFCPIATSLAIFEDCHDRIFRYKVLALVTSLSIQKDMVLSFDHQGQSASDDTHAIAQECAQKGYELVKVKYLKVTQRPIIITTNLYQVASTVKHYKALVTVKRPDLQRPIVLEFARRVGIMYEETAKDIEEWAAQECAEQDYRLVELQTVHKNSWHWKYFPEKFRHLLL